MKTYEIGYSGYFYDPQDLKVVYKTKVDKENIREAIIFFINHYNAQLIEIYNKNNLNDFAIAKPHNEKNYRNEIIFYYENFHKEIVFDERELYKNASKINPIDPKIKPDNAWISPDGEVYKCGFQEHKYIASELFHTRTIEYISKEEEEKLSYSYNFEQALENRGWIKISNGEIININELTNAQIKIIIKFGY